MHKIIKIVLAAAISAAYALSASAQTMPEVTVEDSQGKEVIASSLINGKPAIISFWSTICKPCIQELNAINEALEDWRAEADFDVIAVSTDDVRMLSSAKARAAALGWEFICVYDPNQDLKRAMNVSVTPHSFVVDAEGNIVSTHTGYTPGSEELLFEEILELSK